MISFFTALLGCWLLATTPFLYDQSHGLLYSDLACGICLLVVGLGLRRVVSIWKGWVIGAVGFWLSFAPLAFWAPHAAAYLNSTLS